MKASVGKRLRLTVEGLAALALLKLRTGSATWLSFTTLPNIMNVLTRTRNSRVVVSSQNRESVSINGRPAAIFRALVSLTYPRADVVVIAAPHTAETAHLIGERELGMLKDGAVLINVSRGKLIDEAALARELDRGRIRAGLDVFEHEPLAAGSPLWTSTHAMITPHVAGFFG